MKRVLLAGFKQETSCFNPVVTRYERFHISGPGEFLSTLGGTRTELGGAIDVLQAAPGVEMVPAMAAWCESGGPVEEGDLQRLTHELLTSIQAASGGDGSSLDGVYLALHGAMAGTSQVDPEGHVLAEVRRLLGPRPIVASLDLHAVLTNRMVSSAHALVPFHTYPHTDQYETGQRAARLLLKLLAGDAEPATARVALPMLVRGDELLTDTGLFGEAMARCRRVEASPGGLAAGVLIGNPFTDVPDLRSNVIVTRDGDPQRAGQEAEDIAHYMWDNRRSFVAELTPLDEAIGLASTSGGTTVFSDAADATSSGASGDSNHILRGLLAGGFAKRALLTLVDAPAAHASHASGVGSTVTTPLGGTLDPGRHTPLTVAAYVKALGDGDFAYEDGTRARAGQSAVLEVGSISVLVTEHPVHVMGRSPFTAHGLDPVDFDLVVVKSPNGFRTHYESIASRIIPVDVPGSTSANLRSLPYRRCARPVFPLDSDEDMVLDLSFETGTPRRTGGD